MVGFGMTHDMIPTSTSTSKEKTHHIITITIYEKIRTRINITFTDTYIRCYIYTYLDTYVVTVT